MGTLLLPWPGLKVYTFTLCSMGTSRGLDASSFVPVRRASYAVGATVRSIAASVYANKSLIIMLVVAVAMGMAFTTGPRRRL